MTDFIRNLCERMARGLELDPQLLAARIGTVSGTSSGTSFKVVPFDPAFSSAEVMVNSESGMTEMVNLIPAVRLLLGELEGSLGHYTESPRLPFSPRKFRFSPEFLGGQVKSGQLWTGQNRPVAPGRVLVDQDRSVLQVSS